MRFFRAWLMEAVPQRLLAFRDGERRLTNLLHLAELLHLASCARPGRGLACSSGWSSAAIIPPKAGRGAAVAPGKR